MQKRKNSIRNIAIVLLNIIMVVSLVLVLKLGKDYCYSLYWTITPILMILVLLVIQKWSARGLNVDMADSKTIQRAFDDSTTILTVFFGVIYLLIQGAEFWYKNITHNIFVIVGFFIVMIIYELFTYLSIYNAKKGTRELLEKKYNHKK